MVHTASCASTRRPEVMSRDTGGGHRGHLGGGWRGSSLVAEWGSSTITRIDPATNAIVGTLDNPLGTSHSVVPTESGVW